MVDFFHAWSMCVSFANPLKRTCRVPKNSSAPRDAD